MNKYNKIAIAIISSATLISSANYFVIVNNEKFVVGGFTTDITYGEWTYLEDQNCSYDLEENDFYYGVPFDQVETCERVEERVITTTKTYDNGHVDTSTRTEIQKETVSYPAESLLGKHLESSCKGALDFDSTLVSQRYTINIPNQGNTRVSCDMDTDGGGWTIIQYRTSYSEFKNTYSEYEDGFGGSTNFWLGNKNIHELTLTPKELYIELTHESGEVRNARYTSFNVNAASDKYRMFVSGYSGNAGDSLAYHSNNVFSAYDQDNDNHSDNCANRFHGGWWYNACHSSNLNGYYYDGASPYAEGLTWSAWTGQYYSLPKTKLMIR